MRGTRLAVFAVILALALPLYAQSGVFGGGGCGRSHAPEATDSGLMPGTKSPGPPLQAPTPETLNLQASLVAVDALGGFLFSLAQDSSICKGAFSSEMPCPQGGTFSIGGSCELSQGSCDWDLSGIGFLFEECGFDGATLDGSMALNLSLASCDPSQGVQAKLDSNGLGHGGDIRVMLQGDPVHLTSLVVDLSVAPNPITVKIEKLSRIAGTFGDTCCLQDSGKRAIRCSREDSDDNGLVDLCDLKAGPPDKPPQEGKFQPCMACDSDRDCPTTVSCLEGTCDFECDASFLCESDEDCSPGAFCIGGTCNFTPLSCGRDEDCVGFFGPGTTCDHGSCTPKSCSTDAECETLGGSCGPSGYCQWARCIEHGDYLGNEDIPDDCRTRVLPLSGCDLAGFCTAPVCKSSLDCPEHNVCTGGLCMPGEGGGGGSSCDPFPSCVGNEECQQAMGPDYGCVSGCCAFIGPPPCQEACGCADASELNNVECVDGPQPDAACETFLSSQLPPGTDPATVAALAGCSVGKAGGAGCCDLLRPAGGLACGSDAECTAGFGGVFGGTWTCDESFSCAPVCGDGTCLPVVNEDCQTCPADCGTCSGPVCGDGNCDASGGESCSSCASDCGACAPVCGDRLCDSFGGESCSSCPSDCGACGPVCGDRLCDGRNGESCSSCPTDCGACPSVCGDRICDAAGGESCSSCPTDCGACTGGK